MFLSVTEVETRTKNSYFNWLYSMMTDRRFPPSVSYWKLFSQLHATEFVYTIPHDENRAEDGKTLRWEFEYLCHVPNAQVDLAGPCSVLEMMVALARRIEGIADDVSYGDRTAQWFWNMIVNLGLGGMRDDHYDYPYVESVLRRFLRHGYTSDGHGGLFVVRNTEKDMRTIEIWYQAMEYLNNIL